MRVLLTRPEVDARATASVLRDLGHEVIVDPVLDIRFADTLRPEFDGVSHWLATSRNGVRALVHFEADRSVPLLAVGSSTAALARQAGFTTVHDADGDVTDLVQLVRDRVLVDGGTLFHAAGSEISGDLAAALSGLGYRVRRQVLYAAVSARELRPETLAALDGHAIDAALFYSPRSAAGFAALVAASGRLDECRSITACCISQRAAEALQNVSFRRVLAAPRPRQSDLLDLLQQCVS